MPGTHQVGGRKKGDMKFSATQQDEGPVMVI